MDKLQDNHPREYSVIREIQNPGPQITSPDAQSSLTGLQWTGTLIVTPYRQNSSHLYIIPHSAPCEQVLFDQITPTDDLPYLIRRHRKEVQLECPC